jgi:hypothetical protein
MQAWFCPSAKIRPRPCPSRGSTAYFPEDALADNLTAYDHEEGEAIPPPFIF